MAKARSLVGLDVHAAKIVAAVLDGETGELEGVCDERRGLGERGSVLCWAAAAGEGPADEAARPGIRSRASWPSAGLSAWSQRRRRSRAQSATRSRTIVATPSTSSGCCWPAKRTRFVSRALRRKRCAILFARARRCGWI